MPPVPPDPDSVRAPASLPPRVLAALCALIVVAATAVRTWVAGAGWFYWDDLMLHGLAATHPLPGPELLLTDHDGHLMPGGMALAWLTAHTAPLDFRLPLLQIALLQLLAGAAVARMLWVLLRGRTVMLAPLILVLAIPLALPAATWWSAAVLSLPLTAATALGVASTVRLAQTGRRRHAVVAVLATVLGLLFVEKAVLVPVIAAAVLLGWWWTSPLDDDEARGSGRDRRPAARAVLRSTRWMWAAQAVVLVAWGAVFAVSVGRIGGTAALADVDTPGGGPGLWALVDHTYRLAVAPTLAGGPWQWGRWHPGPPSADPPTVAVVAGILACAVVLSWSLVTRRRTGPVWMGAALYPMVSVLLVAVGRTGPETAAEIVQTLRYHADSAVVLAAALGLALVAPRRPGAGPSAIAWGERWAIAGLVLLITSSSSISTATYRDVWAEQPSRDYFAPLIESLREREAPMLDTEVPLEVLLPVTHPANQLSHVLGGVPGTPPIGAWTPEPVVVDADGALHPAGVVPGRTIPEGPVPDCGHRIATDGTRIELDGPLLGRDWVVRINYFSGTDGTVAVRLDEGEEVAFPVSAGLGTVYVRVEGSGMGVTLTPRHGVSDLCIGRGTVGVLVPR